MAIGSYIGAPEDEPGYWDDKYPDDDEIESEDDESDWECAYPGDGSMSSKRHIRRLRCERKIKYHSAGEARAEAKEIAERKGDFLSVYPCEFGSHWHTGHAPHNVNVAQAYKGR